MKNENIYNIMVSRNSQLVGKTIFWLSIGTYDTKRANMVSGLDSMRTGNSVSVHIES